MLKELIKVFGLVKDFSDSKEWLGKRWFLSKTLWLNVIALLALIFQNHLGMNLTSEEQVGLLAVINMILRLVTNQPLVMKEESIINVQKCEDESNNGI